MLKKSVQSASRAGLLSTARRMMSSVAPTLFIPRSEPEISRESQIEKNTQIALEVLRLQRGPLPASYTRKYTTTVEKLAEEIEELLGSAAKLRRVVKDDEPLDKIGSMERALRHAMWSYLKDNGSHNFEEMEKWLVYSSTDQQRLTDLRQRMEKKEKLAALRAQSPVGAQPELNLNEEYENVVDREALVEKRFRYQALSLHTQERDEAKISQQMWAYLQPIQLKRLDRICELLERFRPILAREAIMQRLTVKHLEGKLGLWRYLDWNPEVRDRAELEADHYAQQWWYTNEEKRLSQIRLRSRNELNEIAERNQAKLSSQSSNASSVGIGGDAVQAAREKLLQEVIRLQSRVGSKGNEESDDKTAQSEEARKLVATQAEEQKQIKVPEEIVNQRGILGLDFISEETLASSKSAKAN